MRYVSNLCPQAQVLSRTCTSVEHLGHFLFQRFDFDLSPDAFEDSASFFPFFDQLFFSSLVRLNDSALRVNATARVRCFPANGTRSSATCADGTACLVTHCYPFLNLLNVRIRFCFPKSLRHLRSTERNAFPKNLECDVFHHFR